MTSIDPAILANDISDAASGILKKDVTTVQGFVQAQVNAISQQAAIVASGITDGSISEDLQGYFLDNLEKMTQSFVNTLVGILTVILEKILNAIIAVIWKAIDTATGLSLSPP